MDNPYDPFQPPFSVDTSYEEENPEEKARKETVRKRMYFLLLGICFVLIAVLVWEFVEISMGGFV